MPTYSYQCKKCNHIQDVFHSMSATPSVKCEICGGKCGKLLGTGAGIIFKGSGFYETDYKKKDKAPEAKTDTGKAETSSSETSSTKTEKPSGSGETKASTKATTV